jgi:hypothetical protein
MYLFKKLTEWRLERQSLSMRLNFEKKSKVLALTSPAEAQHRLALPLALFSVPRTDKSCNQIKDVIQTIILIVLVIY